MYKCYILPLGPWSTLNFCVIPFCKIGIWFYLVELWKMNINIWKMPSISHWEAKDLLLLSLWFQVCPSLKIGIIIWTRNSVKLSLLFWVYVSLCFIPWIATASESLGNTILKNKKLITRVYNLPSLCPLWALLRGMWAYWLS